MSTAEAGRQRGMTLIELMIVVVIVAILSAIAIPSYRSYVLRVNRTDAKAALTTAASFMERCFTRNTPPSYVGCPAAGGYPMTVAHGTYTVGITVPNARPNEFVASAQPQGSQADDTKCATFTLNQIGFQDIVGGTQTRTECW